MIGFSYFTFSMVFQPPLGLMVKKLEAFRCHRSSHNAIWDNTSLGKEPSLVCLFTKPERSPDTFASVIILRQTLSHAHLFHETMATDTIETLGKTLAQLLEH
jgi:hypothetical protein